MEEKTKFKFQPVSTLPMLAELIDKKLPHHQRQHQNLLKGRTQPHVFDDALLDRVRAAYRQEIKFQQNYQEQLNRWKQGEIGEEQRKTIERLEGQIARTQEVCNTILTLVDELMKGTINRILEMDDAQLALEVLSGKIKLP